MMIRMITMVMKMRLRNKRFRPTNLQTCPGIPTVRMMIMLPMALQCSIRMHVPNKCLLSNHVYMVDTVILQQVFPRLGPKPIHKEPCLEAPAKDPKAYGQEILDQLYQNQWPSRKHPRIYWKKHTFISAPCTTIAWNKLCKGNPGISHVPAWACQFLSCFFKWLIALSFQMPGIYRSLEQLLEIEPGLKQFLCQGQQTMPE